MTSRWGFDSNSDKSRHVDWSGTRWKNWPCRRAAVSYGCPSSPGSALYPCRTPGPLGPPDTRGSRDAPRGSQSLAQPRGWVWGDSLEGSRGSSHTFPPQSQLTTSHSSPCTHPRNPAHCQLWGSVLGARGLWRHTHLSAWGSQHSHSALEERPYESLS